MNAAYLGAWNTIPPKRPNTLFYYVCKIVRNISMALEKEKNVYRCKSTSGISVKLTVLYASKKKKRRKRTNFYPYMNLINR